MRCEVSFAGSEFYISEKDKYPAYQAIRKQFVGAQWLQTCHSIEDMLLKFGVIVITDIDDNIVEVRNIDYEKLHTCILKTIFAAIAPYIKEGSFIHLYDSDGTHWRWVFKDAKCIYVKATLTWKETEETAHECE